MRLRVNSPSPLLDERRLAPSTTTPAAWRSPSPVSLRETGKEKGASAFFSSHALQSSVGEGDREAVEGASRPIRAPSRFGS